MAFEVISVKENNKSDNVKKSNDQSITNTISNISNILVSLDILADAAREAASAIASVFEAAASIDVGLNNDLERMQIALRELGAAAYEKFQNPMQSAVQEVTNYVDILAKSIADKGELSKSFEKIATGMSNIASSAITLTAEGVLPAVIKPLGWIMDNGQAIITAVTSVAAAVAAYKIAAEAAAIATTALNLSINFTPWLLPIAEIVGAVAAALLIMNSTSKEASFTAETLSDKIQDETDAIKEQRKALEDLKKAQDEKNAADDAEADNIERLWGELQKYVDRTGNVISNNERANAIISLLNNNYGMNIECIGDQIQGYGKLANSMDGYLEKLRLESRIRNGQASYDEAITECDKLIKKQTELREQIQSANALINKQEDAGETAAATITKQASAALGAQLEEVNAAIADYKSVIDEYEELFSEKDPYAGKSMAQINAEEYAKKAQQSDKEFAEKKKENTQKLNEAWKKLDHEYAMGVIASDDDLYSARLNLLDKYGDESNSEHWRYYEELYSQEQKATEDAAKAQKQAIQDKWDSISKQERLGLISSEEAYRQQLELIEQYCPEYADEWYDYYQTIVEYQRNALKEQVQGVRDNISDMVSEYRNAFGELESSVSSYKNKLLSVESIFTVKTETDDQGNETTFYTVENMTEQMEKMQKYHDLVKSLKDRGVSNEVLSELTTLDFDEGMVFAENLAMSSDEDLEKITALYAKRDKLAEDLANELYAPEMDKLNEDLIAGITEQFGTLPEDIRAIGGQSLAAFIEGVLDDKANLSDAAQEFMDNFFEACNEGISSGSVGMKNVGQNIADALGEQDTYSIGFEKGKELLEGLSEALSDFDNKLLAGHAEVSAGLVTAVQNVQGSYGSSSWSGSSGRNERIVFENKEEVTVKIDKDVLGKAMRDYTREYERRTGT